MTRTTKSTTKAEQFRQETQAWGRALFFHKHENAFLKNRLSEVVDLVSNKDGLALAEHFQNLLIIKDEMLDELRHDVNAQERLLQDKEGNTLVHLVITEGLVKRQAKLRNEMEYFEKDFAVLKNEFNKYVATMLQ